MIQRTRQITTVGMLCAMAYALVALVRIPLVLFLEYEPKDVVIAIGGLVYGPFTSFLAAAIVALLEMVTISEDGILGCVMNVLSSCSFACTAAYIYGRRRTPGGAVLGLLCGWVLMAAVMLLWNYLIAPLYMGQPREAVAPGGADAGGSGRPGARGHRPPGPGGAGDVSPARPGPARRDLTNTRRPEAEAPAGACLPEKKIRPRGRAGSGRRGRAR